MPAGELRLVARPRTVEWLTDFLPIQLLEQIDARLFPRQWQYCPHACNRRLMSLLIAGTGLAHLTIGQACPAPRACVPRSVLVGGRRTWRRSSRRPQSRNDDAPATHTCIRAVRLRREDAHASQPIPCQDSAHRRQLGAHNVAIISYLDQQMHHI
jgi:hypothetical protein